MKTFRVTLKYKSNNHISVVSITVPAAAGDQAIDTTIRTNNLVGTVVSAKAVEIINH